MKKAVMQKWVEALRSGKYKQGRGQLRKGKGKAARHCCLGVLCDIYNPEGWTEANCFTDEEYILPVKVKNWAGMKDEDGLSGCYNLLTKKPMKITECVNLIYLNDDKKYSFKKIANIIEENYKKF